MRAREPSWWYGSAEDPRTRWLAPLGHLYGTIAERRYRRTTPYRAAPAVICIGNFTAGGTGKTPLSLLVAEHLKEMGARPVFLTRGYGGTIRTPTFIDPERHTADDCGDEPLLLARAAPVILARDRAAGARLAEADARRFDAIVMDDGLQNATLAKRLTLAVMDGARGVGNGEVIPAGPLRAELEFQLALTDAIIVNGGPADPAPDSASVLARLRRGFAGPVLSARPEAVGDTAWLDGTPVAAFAAIGNPERFFALLRTLGADVRIAHAFPDHHVYTAAQARTLLDAARVRGLQLVTTEKDWVRLPRGEGPMRELKERVRTLPIRLVFEEREMLRLKALIESALAAPG